MYCTRSCPYCTRAEKLLKKKGVNIEKIDVNSRNMWKEMEKITKRNTVPQIFIGETHVGGFDDLSALEFDGKLDSLLKSA